MGGDALFLTGEAEPFLGGGFDADMPLPDAAQRGNALPHGGDMRFHLRGLRQHGRVDIADGIAVFTQQPHRLAQQFAAVRTFVTFVGIGEPAADVAQRRRAQQRIHDRVQQHIRIRMTEQAGFVRDGHPAHDQRATRHQPVHIVTVADPHGCLSPFL